MRIREILPEDWWKDLDHGFLGMMGYTKEALNDEEPVDLKTSVEHDVKSIRQNRSV